MDAAADRPLQLIAHSQAANKKPRNAEAVRGPVRLSAIRRRWACPPPVPQRVLQVPEQGPPQRVP
jgi:hypothetical protein